MPYIIQERRHEFNDQITNITNNIQSVGELNFVISMICKNFVHKQGESYQTYNSVIGVLESSKLEFYRRAVSSYEDIKILENGDVFDSADIA